VPGSSPTASAAADQLRARGLDPGGLRGRDGLGHVHDGRQAECLRGRRDTEAVVAARSRDDTAWSGAGEQRVDGAAQLERTTALQVLQLEHHGPTVDFGP
jgi:hypothetical protein